MSADLLLIRGKGGRQAPAAFPGGTKMVFANSPGKRTNVYVTTYGAAVYLKVTNVNDADPVTTAADYDFVIPAATTVLFPWTSSIAIWPNTADKVSGVEVYS